MNVEENKRNAIAFYKTAYEGNGKICEHWDTIQQIPEDSANPNTMY